MLKLIMNSVNFIDVEPVKILQLPLPFNTFNTTISALVDLTATLPGLFPPLSLLRLLPAESPMLLPVLNLALLVAVEGLEKIVSSFKDEEHVLEIFIVPPFCSPYKCKDCLLFQVFHSSNTSFRQPGQDPKLPPHQQRQLSCSFSHPLHHWPPQCSDLKFVKRLTGPKISG